MAGKRRKKFRYLRKISFLRKFLYLAVIAIALLIKYFFEMTIDPYNDYYEQYYEKLNEDVAKYHQTSWDCDDLCMVQFHFYLETFQANDGYFLSTAVGLPDAAVTLMFGAQYGLFIAESNADTLSEIWQVKDADNELSSFMGISADHNSIENTVYVECDNSHHLTTNYLTFVAGLQVSMCADEL